MIYLVENGIAKNEIEKYLDEIRIEEIRWGNRWGIAVDLEENLKVYYEKRGWEWDTGYPSPEKLKELNIIKS